MKRFKEGTDKVVAQYGAYEPVAGKKVNGELTLGENIADLAGITIAYDGWKRSLGGKKPKAIDGFTGDQRFFLGFSQVWRQKYREPALLQQLVTDPHTLLPLERVEPAAAIVQRIVTRVEPLLNRVVRLLDILLGGELDRIVLELLDSTGDEEGAE